MKVILLTNCIFREKFIEEQLHLLGHEVFISESLLKGSSAMVQFFDMIILSDTLPTDQQVKVAKGMSNFQVPILRVSREAPLAFTDIFEDVLNPDSELEEMGNKLATISKLYKGVKPKQPILNTKWNKNQDFFNSLSKLERKLLNYLMKTRGKVISRREISLFIWEGEFTLSRQCHISNIVKRIRKKMELYQLDQVQIITVWGEGYFLEPVNGWEAFEEESKWEFEEQLQQTLV